MNNRMFDAEESLSDKESIGFEKAFIVFGDDCMPIGRPGKVSGQMVIDTMAEMFEEEPRERKPLSRQESFGSYLRKGKKW